MQLPPKVTERAFDRLAEIGAASQGQALRVAVEGGGCSGFQYEITLDSPSEDDLVLEHRGVGHQFLGGRVAHRTYVFHDVLGFYT